jgi:hypothetical protein
VSLDEPLSPDARREVERELERRRRQRLSRLGIGSAIVMSAAALALSLVAYIDGRDHATKADVEAINERIDDIDEYARPLGGDVSGLRERVAGLEKAVGASCDAISVIRVSPSLEGGGLELGQEFREACRRLGRETF